MRKFWDSISHIGVINKTQKLEYRSIVLTNQINFVFLAIMVFLNIATTIIREMEDGSMTYGTLRLLLLLFVNLLIIILNYNHWYRWAKIILAIFPVLILFVVPTFFGFVEDESFFYYQVAIIGLSVIPHVIFLLSSEEVLYWTIVAAFFILILFIDNLLFHFTPVNFPVLETINKFLFYYKVIPVLIFILVNLTVVYLKKQNLQYENEILCYTQKLKSTNQELITSNDIIQGQKEKLESALKNLKETESQLIQSEKMASLGTFTAGVAHEINNPLNFLMGAYVGLDNYFDEYGSYNERKTKILLENMKIGIDRISNIIIGLNQFSRKSSDIDEECNIHSILENCVVIMHNQLKHKTQVVKKYAHDNLIIKGNVGKLHQVFLNIIANANQAIKKEGVITFATKKEKQHVCIEISDNGCGISKNYIAQIIDPFFTTKPPGEGTGLGLSIVYNIIKEHNGILEFESKENIGTKVIVRLPRT